METTPPAFDATPIRQVELTPAPVDARRSPRSPWRRRDPDIIGPRLPNVPEIEIAQNDPEGQGQYPTVIVFFFISEIKTTTVMTLKLNTSTMSKLVGY